MNWNRAKIVLIFLFLAINLFLYNMLKNIEEKHETIENVVIENAALASHLQGIKISKDIIPPKRYKNGEMELFSVSSEPEKAAERFLGRKYERLLSDDLAHFYKYKSEEGILEINKSRLLFKLSDDIQTIKNEKEAAEKALSELEKYGIKRKEIKLIKNGKNDGRSYFKIKPCYKNYDIDGAEFTVYYDGGGITEVIGSWFDFESFSQSGDFLNDVTSVITLLKADNEKTVEIVEIDFSYYVTKELLYGKYVSAIPVYIFKTADGETFIIDSRTGEKV